MPGGNRDSTQTQTSGRAFNVRLDITVPGKELVVNREADEDVYVALRDAFNAARRQLEDYGRRQRGEIKRMRQCYTAR